MMKPLLAVGMLFGMSSQTPGEPMAPSQEGVFPYAVQRLALENGLKVIMVPMPSEGLVAYWSVVRTGSRDEVEEGVTGFAHFFEHMMFRGSEKFPGAVYDSIVTSMGADANAYTTDDLTAYHMSFTTADLPKVVEIEADRFKNLTYTEDEFKTESGAVYGEYRKGRTSPFFVLFEGLQKAAFDQHTYRHTTIGYEADIQRMPQQFAYSKTFFQRFYRPENVVLFIAGDFDTGTAEKLVRKHYSDWRPGYVAPRIPVEPAQAAPRRVVIPFEGQTLPIVSVSFKGDRFQPADRTMMAATLIGELAFGQTSKLYRRLVLDEQRVEGLFEDFGFNRDPKLWSVFAMVKDPADVPAIERLLYQTLADLRQQPVAEERLDAVRSRLKYSFLSGLTTPSDVAGGLARLIAITGDITCVDEMYATLDQVTPADVQRAAGKYLREEASTVAWLHSEGEPIPVADGAADEGDAVLLPVPEDPNVALRVWVKVGSQDDPPGKEGLAALTAALLSDGSTENHRYEDILEQLFPLAAGYGASVDKEMTVFRGQVHRDKIAEFYPLLVDALLRPAFDADDFERIRANTISGIENTLRYASDEELGKEALFGEVFRDTPYHHLIEGSVAALKSITLEDVRAFYQKYYTRKNVLLGVGGAYEGGLPARLHVALQELPAGQPPRMDPPEPARVEGRHVILVEKPGPSVAISFGAPVEVRRGSREFYALWLANSWLGEHRNSVSHLYQVIREARGMNYGDYSYIEAFPGGGRRSFPPTGVGRRAQLFEVWIRPVPREQTRFALRAALREVDRLIESGLTEEQFQTTRDFLVKYVLHFAETTSDRLGYAVDDRFYGIEEGHLKRFRDVLPTLTRDEVNAAIRKHLQTSNLVFALVTADAEEMKAQLTSGSASPIEYGDVTKPDDVLAEDLEIQSYPLGFQADRIKIVPVSEMFAGEPRN